MNLVEVLKSGRPFKRAHWINYITARSCGAFIPHGWIRVREVIDP